MFVDAPPQATSEGWKLQHEHYRFEHVSQCKGHACSNSTGA